MNGCLSNYLTITVVKSPLNYFLADSSTMVHRTNTPLLEKKKKWCHPIIWLRQHKLFCLFLPFLGKCKFFYIPCNFISFKEKESEFHNYINPLSTNPTKWSNTCKNSFISTVRENLYSQKFLKTCHSQKQVHTEFDFFTRENKSTRKLVRLM